MTPTSLGQVLLNEACQSPEAWKRLAAAVHRTQLWSYRKGKTKPTVDTAALIASACPTVPVESWGQPAPETQTQPKEGAA